MQFSGLAEFSRHGIADLRPGPVAVLFLEDHALLTETFDYLSKSGFRNIVACAAPSVRVPGPFRDKTFAIDHDIFSENARGTVMNALIEALPGRWLLHHYNAEFLFFPFCETRTVGEMIAFVTEERRFAIPAFTIDLYAGDLDSFPTGVSVDNAHIDSAGYYASGRPGPDNNPLERQLNMFGGLRWRYEEYVPDDRRRIDRTGLFRAKPGLQMRPDGTLSDEEMNTYACPWHHSTTSTVCSFRAAKALKSNPDSAAAIGGFAWHNSRRFTWSSQQLMDYGLMEPGQWF